jgi:NADPH-dependent glutamate synthase beta subunit-like oxidoreductase
VQVVQRRVDLMTAEGIKFITNIDVGKDMPARILAQASRAHHACQMIY